MTYITFKWKPQILILNPEKNMLFSRFCYTNFILLVYILFELYGFDRRNMVSTLNFLVSHTQLIQQKIISL